MQSTQQATTKLLSSDDEDLRRCWPATKRAQQLPRFERENRRDSRWKNTRSSPRFLKRAWRQWGGIEADRRLGGGRRRRCWQKCASLGGDHAATVPSLQGAKQAGIRGGREGTRRRAKNMGQREERLTKEDELRQRRWRMRTFGGLHSLAFAQNQMRTARRGRGADEGHAAGMTAQGEVLDWHGHGERRTAARVLSESIAWRCK